MLVGNWSNAAPKECLPSKDWPDVESFESIARGYVFRMWGCIRCFGYRKLRSLTKFKVRLFLLCLVFAAVCSNLWLFTGLSNINLTYKLRRSFKINEVLADFFVEDSPQTVSSFLLHNVSKTSLSTGVRQLLKSDVDYPSNGKRWFQIFSTLVW